MFENDSRNRDFENGPREQSIRDKLLPILWAYGRGWRAFQRMEERLTTELRADKHHGYRVVLVNWPSSENRTLGLIVADFTEPDTGHELAAVFIPNTPDPTKGSIRVVSSGISYTPTGISRIWRGFT